MDPKAHPAYALVSSLSRATRSCGSLALLMRYSGSPLLPGSCLTTSKTPPGAFRLIAGLTITVSVRLSGWKTGGHHLNPIDGTLTGAHPAKRPDPPLITT